MISTTTAFIGFGTWVGGKLADKGFESIHKKLTSIDKNNKFYSLVNDTATELQKKYPNVLGGEIEYFFKHEEVFNEIAKLLFVDSKIDLKTIQKHIDIKTLPEGFISEFISLLRSKLLADKDFSSILANKEIYIACIGISNSLDTIAETSQLSFEEIKKIKSVLEQKLIKKFDFKTFKKNYLENTFNILSQVNFIGLGVDLSIKKGKRKKIEDVFVEPTFSTSDIYLKSLNKSQTKEFVNKEGYIECKNILKIQKNLIILGNPGSGKSFLVKSLICNIIKKENTKNNFLPFRIELRKYLSHKKEKGGNILSYLVYLIESEYGIPNVLESSLDKILNTKKTCLFFDGLDEIFSINDKIQIKNDIESFHNIYDNLFSITTSRIIGYEEASLNSKNFFELRINNFDNTQVKEYVNKWYSIEEEDEKTCKIEVGDFLSKKNNIDEELISNPLLLSLIVILYRNNLKLPESKLEIYQSCTSTLVDKWDVSKQLTIELDQDIYKRKEAILAELAHWQYNELTNKRGKITYTKAKNNVGKTIQHKLNLADEFTVNDVSEKFMEYARKRSIYFDNQFTHKTFLEYYTAFWIYSNIEKKHKKDERDKIISRFIDNPFWHIVLELLFNLIDKDQADNEIMDELLEVQLLKPRSSLLHILNILPSLQNVSIACVNLVFAETLNLLIRSKILTEKNLENFAHQKENKYSSIFRAFSKLNNNEKFKAVQEEVLLKAYEDAKSERTKVKILFIELEMNVLKGLRTENLSVNALLLNRQILKRPDVYMCNHYFKALKSGNGYMSYNLQEDFYKFCELFGKEKTFERFHSFKFTRLRLGGLFSRYLDWIFASSSNISNLSKIITELNSIGFTIEEIVEAITKKSYFLHVVKVSIYIKQLNLVTSKNEKILLYCFLIQYSKNKSYQILFNRKTKYYNVAEFIDLIKDKKERDFFQKIIDAKKIKQATKLVFNRFGLKGGNYKNILEELDD